MVAIALYKGYLRRLPDVPRKWTMPTRQISFKDFKNLQRRLSKALSRITTSTATTSINPSLNQDAEPEISVSKDGGGEIGGEEVGKPLENGAVVIATCSEAIEVKNTAVESRIDDVGTEENLVVDDSVTKVVEDHLSKKVAEDQKEMEMEGKVVTVDPSPEIRKNEDSITDEGKRKKELEEKLHMLKEKKHGLVQALKQILNAEEELKRRNSAQGTAGRTSAPLHLDIPKDSVSLTRLNTPRTGSDGILTSEVEGAEPEGSFNQNADTRPFFRTSSASPSSESQNKKLSGNAIPHLARTASAVSGSPSRFAPSGHQGHPSVSVSGTNYVVSSPSPAASGGTSAFRDNNWT